MSQPLRLGVAGLGTVGAGLLRLAQSHADSLAEAAGRPSEAQLLLRSNGDAWGHGRSRHHRDDFRAVVKAAELDPDIVTLSALRHSSIVRQLLANLPIRIVATLHDTSVKMIERTYSRHIAEHTDALARRALLETAQPPADNVVALSGRRS